MTDIPFSNKYHQDLRSLQIEHQEKRITDEEFSRRLDELRKREAKSHESVGRILLLQELKNVEKETEQEVKEKLEQERRERETQEQTKRFADRRRFERQEQERRNKEDREFQEQKRREAERYDFRNTIDHYINRLESKARQLQRGYTTLQIFLIVFSAGTATMAGIEGVPRGWVSLTGYIATIAGGFLTTFKIQERIYATRKAVAEVRLETQKYDYHVNEYTGNDPEQRFLTFNGTITAIQGQEMLQEVEFWNPKKEEKKEEKTTQTNPQEDRKDEVSNEIPEKTDQEEKLSDSEK